MENVTQLQFIDTFGSTGPQGVIDVDTGSQFTINFSIGDVREPFSKKGVKSYKFEIVGSKENNKLLNHYYDINIVDGTYNNNRKQKVAVLRNGVVILDNAYLQLLQIKKNNKTGPYSDQQISYEVEVGDDVTSFFTEITNKYLDELDFLDMVHTYEASNVVASFGNSAIRNKVLGTGGYKYVLAWTPLSKYNLEECRPAISVYEYWDRIHQAAGYQWEWLGFDTDAIRMDKLWIPYNGDTPKASDQNLNMVAAENSAPLLYDNSIAFEWDIDTQDFIINTEVQDLSGLYNPVTGIYTSNIYTGASALDVTFEVTYQFEYDNTTLGTAYLTLPGGLPATPMSWVLEGFCDMKSLLTGFNYNNAVWMNETLETVVGTPYTLAPGLNTISSGTIQTATIPVMGLVFGEQLETRIGVKLDLSPPFSGLAFRTAISGGTPVDVRPYLTITSIKMIIVPRADNYGFNSQVSLNDFVPAKIKQSDFIKSIANMYNLVIAPDSVNDKKIIYSLRDDYYDIGSQKDWTNKLVTDKEESISFISNTNAKKVILSYKPDTDIINKDYLAQTKEVYGQLEYTLGNENIKGVEYKEIIFSPTPCDNTSFGTVNPMWVGQSPKCNIRILIDGGIQPTGMGGSMTYDIVDYTSGGVDYGVFGISTYPMLTHQDNPTNPVFDINFGLCDKYYHDFETITNNNLYTMFWRRTIGQIDSGKLLAAYFILTEYDISILKLNDKIFIKDTWYNINSLPYDPNSLGPTKVVLMTIDNELSIGFPKTYLEIGKPILGTLAMESFSEEIYATHNWNYADSSVRVMGTGNRVGSGVKNALIVGNDKLVNTSNTVYSDRVEADTIILDGQNVLDFLKVYSVNASEKISTTSTSDVIATGMTLTPGAGTYIVNFNSQYTIQSGNVTGQAALDLMSAYNALIVIPATVTDHMAAFGAGETLNAGVYTIAGAGTLAGNLTLDGQGNANAVFIFRFGAAFSTAAASSVILINGANASNIYWIAEGAISMGVSTTMKGTCIANGGAVTAGAGCNIVGRLFSTTGAIGVDGSTITKPSGSYINIGILITFAIFTSVGNVTNTGKSVIVGDIGTNAGTITGFGTATVQGTIYLPGVENNALATFSIYQNGVLIANSSRTRTLLVNTVDVSLQAIATVADLQAIDIRWKVDAGTVNFEKRILTLKKVIA